MFILDTHTRSMIRLGDDKSETAAQLATADGVNSQRKGEWLL